VGSQPLVLKQATNQLKGGANGKPPEPSAGRPLDEHPSSYRGTEISDQNEAVSPHVCTSPKTGESSAERLNEG
jgi:hypothetical protein